MMLKRLKQLPALLVLLFTCIIMVLPVFFMLSNSLKNDTEILAFPPTIIPHSITFSNYISIFQKMTFFLYIKNSVIIVFFVVIGTILSSTFVAFGFSRYNAPGKKTLFIIVIATLMIPYPAIMIPQFILFKNLGWVNTFLPLTVPAFFGSAYMIFLLRQFFSSLSDELFDAARIDGCGEVRSFWNIGLPLCGPAVATVAIFAFLWCWDDLLGPVLYLNSMDKYTITVALAGMQSRYRIIPWNTLMVGAIYSIIPVMLLFFFCQRYFVEGIVTTGLKA